MKEHETLCVAPEVGGRLLGYGFGGGMHASGPGFACGLHLMAVLPDGRAAKCTFYGDRPAGTAEEGLRVCWERIRPVRLDELDCDCAVREACRGGCRYRAELFAGPRGRDPYRCALYGFIDRGSQDLLS
jgi:radical SAM protein with 4Fe4S-binding SPASM domain